MTIFYCPCISIIVLILLQFVRGLIGEEISVVWAEEEESIYTECRKGVLNFTMCYGDVDNCVDGKNCTYFALLKETTTSFDITFLDKCSHSEDKSHATFFGITIGMPTFNDQGNMNCSKDLEINDFKLFLFWRGKKCPGHSNNLGNSSFITQQFEKSNWESYCESRQINITRLAGNTSQSNQLGSTVRNNLQNYLDKYNFFTTVYGEWNGSEPPYAFAGKLNYDTTDGKFYIGNYTENCNFKNGYKCAATTLVSSSVFYYCSILYSFIVGYICLE